MISIYGNGTYILGPGVQMRQGKLSAEALQKLLDTLMNVDGLLGFTQSQFYDVPDQNATFLQLAFNNKHYTFQYGKFGAQQESAQALNEYHRLDNALTTIQEALTGPTYPYTNKMMVLLVHQDFSPDLTQNIPEWPLRDFTLSQLAIFECGVIPPDQVGPNAATGCLTFTAPMMAYLPRLATGANHQCFAEKSATGRIYRTGHILPSRYSSAAPRRANAKNARNAWQQ